MDSFVGYPVAVGKQIYALSLEWQSLPLAEGETFEKVSPARRKELRNHVVSQGRERGFDSYLIFRNQYALSNAGKGNGVKVGQTSLATAVASSGPRNMIALLPYDKENNQYYILAVINGIISPDTDVLYSYEDGCGAVEEFLSSIEDASRLQEIEIFVDELPSSFERFLEGLGGVYQGQTLQKLASDGKVGAVRLSDLTKKTFQKNLINGFGILVLLGIGAFGWHKYQEYEVKQAQLAAARMEQARQLSALRTAQLKELKKPYPYGGHLTGVASINMCQHLMEKTSIFLPGWIFQNMKCFPNQGVVHVEFFRDETEHGFLSDVIPLIKMIGKDEKPRPKILVYKTKVEVSYDYSEAFKSLEAYKYADKSPYSSIEKQETYLQSIFDRIGFSRSLKLFPITEPAVVPLKEIPVIDNVEEIAKSMAEGKEGSMKRIKIDPIVFRRLRFNISGVLPPVNFNKVLSPLQGFDIDEIDVVSGDDALKKQAVSKDVLGENPSDQLVWIVSGSLYEGEKQSVVNGKVKTVK